MHRRRLYAATFLFSPTIRQELTWQRLLGRQPNCSRLIFGVKAGVIIGLPSWAGRLIWYAGTPGRSAMLLYGLCQDSGNAITAVATEFKDAALLD